MSDYYPPAAFYFRVDFLLFPSLSGYGFREIDGIESRIETETIREGGNNSYDFKVPTRVTYDTLKLKRGMQTVGLSSAVVAWCMTIFSTGFNTPATVISSPIRTCNVTVTLLNESGMPMASWNFMNAYPVRWEISGFNSESEEVLLEEIELAYTSMVRLPTSIASGAVEIASKVFDSKNEEPQEEVVQTEETNTATSKEENKEGTEGNV